MSEQRIQKIVRSNLSVEAAFKAFTSDMKEWWPLDSHSVSAGRLGTRAQSCTFEPFNNGLIFELMTNGEKTQWGRVIECDPLRNLQFKWHPGQPSEKATDVSLEFQTIVSGQTQIRLQHSGWGVYGTEASEIVKNYEEGWELIFCRLYSNYLSDLAEKTHTKTSE